MLDWIGVVFSNKDNEMAPMKAAINRMYYTINRYKYISELNNPVLC